ncbi:MAG: glycosyltransferase family 4 protein [Acidimicrobiales bacterium]
MPHILVTNDFPPKVGGIQSYLHELWRRLPPGMATVYTTRYEGAPRFDAEQGYRVVRSSRSVLMPTLALVRTIDRLAEETGSGLVLLDPALPVGLAGTRLKQRYGVVVHGAEITVPGRLPLVTRLLGHVLSSASLVVAGGSYPASEVLRAVGNRLPPVVQVPPGVDVERFHPLSAAEKEEARRRLGLPPDALVVASISRLVPRKGMDVLIRAIARLKSSRPDLVLAIGGEGRDERRIRGVARVAGVPVKWLGRLSRADLPLAYAASDVYAMCCRDRWFGLEQEGFGIVFLEAAACGVPQLAGLSGGSAEAVDDGRTGYVVDDPKDDRAVAAALEPLLDDEGLRLRLGRAARERAESDFAYDKLAPRLEQALVEAGG